MIHPLELAAVGDHIVEGPDPARKRVVDIFLDPLTGLRREAKEGDLAATMNSGLGRGGAETDAVSRMK